MRNAPYPARGSRRRTRVGLLQLLCLLRTFRRLLPSLVALLLLPFLVDLLLLNELLLCLVRPFLPFVPDPLQVAVDLLESGYIGGGAILFLLELLSDDVEGRVLFFVLRVEVRPAVDY